MLGQGFDVFAIALEVPKDIVKISLTVNSRDIPSEKLFKYTLVFYYNLAGYLVGELVFLVVLHSR